MLGAVDFDWLMRLVRLVAAVCGSVRVRYIDPESLQEEDVAVEDVMKEVAEALHELTQTGTTVVYRGGRVGAVTRASVSLPVARSDISRLGKEVLARHLTAELYRDIKYFAYDQVCEDVMRGMHG